MRKGTNGTIYRIDSGKQRELGEIAEQLLSRSVGPVPMDWGPADAERAISEIAATADKQVRSEASTPEADVTSLGWRPEIGLSQSLMDILNYYRISGEGRLL